VFPLSPSEQNTFHVFLCSQILRLWKRQTYDGCWRFTLEIFCKNIRALKSRRECFPFVTGYILYCELNVAIGGRDSAVGTAARCELDGPGI